jgi:hypothetical protein
MTSADAEPGPAEPAPAPGPAPAETVPGPAPAPAETVPVPVPAPVGEPALPEQSREDTDAAWGEYSESADDRLDRDRPPHWDDF